VVLKFTSCPETTLCLSCKYCVFQLSSFLIANETKCILLAGGCADLDTSVQTFANMNDVNSLTPRGPPYVKDGVFREGKILQTVTLE